MRGETARALLVSGGQFDCQGQKEHYLTSMNSITTLFRDKNTWLSVAVMVLKR